ncbi:1,4-dihydroxy-2-naphthoate polyprenyltransferase [Pseudoclavibacter endophyticus]|uniref:1,4-dihydroxy-2-naphthoate octaprenyltransferase n=1 Tax=Pseudoclavibacter endophyticus TaxID=1778590 RepID=A0A6H9WNL5_9MICO|nr:1,4-dihydroxy-2-naphthoate polyprenyltransferase [Pseudoclavibacter endophyticus]
MERGNPTQRPGKRARGTGAGLGAWIGGARLRTLPLAISPVILGTAGAQTVSAEGEYHWVRALVCLVVAVFLQIGVNYANDYSDGIRGTDDHRVGPARLTASGRATPTTVRNVAFACFGIAALGGLFLAWRTEQWWLIAIGAAAILAAWFYTGGKRPYGYYGLGEVFVFVFFGLVATAGTMYVQVLQVTNDGWLLAAAAGSFACAVLMVNNLRDIQQDRAAGKRTLAVLIGHVASRWVFGVLALAPYVVTVLFMLLYPNALYSFFSLMLIGPAVLITATAVRAKELVLALLLTSLGSLAYAVLLGLAVAFGPYLGVAESAY